MSLQPISSAMAGMARLAGTTDPVSTPPASSLGTTAAPIAATAATPSQVLSTTTWLGVLHPSVASFALASSQSTPVAETSFSDQVRQGASGFDLMLAQMSKAASSEDPSSVVIPGWSVATPDEMPPGFVAEIETLPGDLQVLPDGRIVSESSGLQAVVFTDGNGNYVLAFAGTDPSSWSDISTDISNGTNGLIDLDPDNPDGSSAYGQAIGITQALLGSAGEGHVVVTGHSLGGGLAAASSWLTGVPAVTFNAAGPAFLTLVENYAGLSAFELIGGPGNRSDRVRNYVLEGDILTTVQEGDWGLADLVPDAVGNKVWLDNATSDAWILGVRAPWDMHGIDNVITSLETTVPSISAVETTADGGSRITVLIPTGGNTYEQVVVEFDGTPEGQAAADTFIHDFPLTGQVQQGQGLTVVSRSTVYLGQWTTGDGALAATVDDNSASITRNADGSSTIMVNIDGGGGTLQQTLYYRPDGTLQRIETHVQYEDGAALDITQEFDTDGQEVIEDRRYTFSYVDENGEPATRTFDEAGMQKVWAAAQVAQDNDGLGLPLLDTILGEDGTPLVGEGTIGFAISLVRAEGFDAHNTLDGYLWSIGQHGDGDGDARTIIEFPEVDDTPADPGGTGPTP